MRAEVVPLSLIHIYKTFLDTFWTAHNHALAMADVKSGQVISGRCYLSWPLTDKEREAGDYSKLFAKGQVYRCLLYTSRCV